MLLLLRLLLLLRSLLLSLLLLLTWTHLRLLLLRHALKMLIWCLLPKRLQSTHGASSHRHHSLHVRHTTTESIRSTTTARHASIRKAEILQARVCACREAVHASSSSHHAHHAIRTTTTSCAIDVSSSWRTARLAKASEHGSEVAILLLLLLLLLRLVHGCHAHSLHSA